MRGTCLEPSRFLAVCAGEDLQAEERQHLDGCVRCQEALAQTQRLAELLKELGQAERNSPATAALWHRIESRLDAPDSLSRLPLPLAGFSRLAEELFKPAVVAAWAVGIVGLLFGIWLAPRSPALQPDDSYPWSSLVEDRVSLSAVYESSFPGDSNAASSPADLIEPANGTSSGDRTSPSLDSSGTAEPSRQGGNP